MANLDVNEYFRLDYAGGRWVASSIPEEAYEQAIFAEHAMREVIESSRNIFNAIHDWNDNAFRNEINVTRIYGSSYRFRAASTGRSYTVTIEPVTSRRADDIDMKEAN